MPVNIANMTIIIDDDLIAEKNALPQINITHLHIMCLIFTIIFPFKNKWIYYFCLFIYLKEPDYKRFENPWFRLNSALSNVH